MTIKEVFYRMVKMQGVAHTTLNPYGPGAVRIHLIPPKFKLRGQAPSVAIINGKDIIPVNMSWAILLNSFIEEVNRYEGNEITHDDLEGIVRRTLKSVKSIYFKTDIEQFRKDLWSIVDTLCAIAYGKEPSEDIGYITIGEYAPLMRAPHRMDLMVSSMARNGRWNCNQKCLHCYAAGQPQSEVKELSTDEWKQIIDLCRKIGIPQITFTGGEPTMRSDIFDLIKYSEWFVTRLNTNGVKLTEEYCEKLYNSNLDSVQITFYSATEDEHNKLVGASNYWNTLKGIKNAVKAGLNVSINTPLCKINSNYVRTLKLLNMIGIKYVSCSGLIVTGNACNDESKSTQLSEEQLYSILEEATKYCEEQHMEISFTSPGWVSEDKLSKLGLSIPACGACLSNMAIAPDGSVVPCQSWLSDDSLGNILEQTWKKIWNSPRCREIRESSATMKYECPLREKESKK